MITKRQHLSLAICIALLSGSAFAVADKTAPAPKAKPTPTVARIVRQALTGTSRLINSQNDVEGYPEVDSVTRSLEVPPQDRSHWLNTLCAEVGVPDLRVSDGKP